METMGRWSAWKVERIAGESCGAYRVSWPDSLMLLAEAGDLALADRGSMYVVVNGGEIGLVDDNSPGMSSTVWGTLPPELVEKMLDWLPVVSLIRFRAVCRRWNTMLCCDKFLEQCERNRGTAIPRCLCLFGAGHHMARRDGGFNTVLKMSLAFLPQDDIDLFPRDSAGGLLCMADKFNARMFVCNPLTKKWVELPDIGISGLKSRSESLLQKDSVHLKVDDLTGAFIVVFGCYYSSSSSFSFHIYDPKVGFWSKAGDVHRDRRSYYHGVIQGDQLYSLDSGSPDRLDEYDLEEQVVTHLRVQGLTSFHLTSQVDRAVPGDCYFTDTKKFQNRLVELRGFLYLVEVSNQPSVLYVRIWRLDKGDYSWKTVASLPRYLSFGLPQSETSWSVACTDDAICFDICICENAATKGLAKSMENHSVVCYNTQKNLWVTNCNYLMNQDVKNLRRSRTLLSYRPRLRYKSLVL